MITWVPTPKLSSPSTFLGAASLRPSEKTVARPTRTVVLGFHPKEIGDDTHAEDNYSQGFTTVVNVGFPAEDASR